MVVTEIGGSTPISEASVEAGNWMTALKTARTAIGETGGVPPGGSVQVASDGTVTIHDGVGRRTYVLAPTETTSLKDKKPPRGPRVPSEDVPRAESSPPAGSKTPSVRVPKPSSAPPPTMSKNRTIAYNAADLGLKPPGADEPATAKETPKAKGGAKKTIAYNAADLGLPVAQASKPVPAKGPDPAKPASNKTIAYNAADLGLTPPEAPSEASGPATAKETPKAKGGAKKTIAYNAADLGLPVPGQEAKPEPAEGPDPAKPAPNDTIAYNAADLGLKPPGADAPATAKETPQAKGGAKKTIAYNAADLGLQLPGQEPAKPEPARPEPAQTAEPEPTDEPAPRMTMPDGPPWELMHSRDDEPSDQSPLVYRERTYFVPEGTSEAVAEAILAARFEEMREELASRAKGKLVNMALFDHRWEGRPERPPLMTLQWKDWRGEPKIGRPRPSQPAPAMSEPPAAAPKPAPAPAPASSASPSDELELSISDDVVDSKPPPRQRRGTDEALANAFEALQDLFFLTTPIEGLEFVVRLLTDLVPAEAYSACLYDINADELRFVALEGPGADAKKGLGVPRLTGLLGAAALSPDRALLVEDVASDGRYDAGSDGRDGVTPTTMALMAVSHQGRLLGMLQVINRTEQAQFSRADANLMAYVAEKLGEFLQAARMRPDEQRA